MTEGPSRTQSQARGGQGCRQTAQPRSALGLWRGTRGCELSASPRQADGAARRANVLLSHFFIQILFRQAAATDSAF